MAVLFEALQETVNGEVIEIGVFADLQGRHPYVVKVVKWSVPKENDAPQIFFSEDSSFNESYS